MAGGKLEIPINKTKGAGPLSILIVPYDGAPNEEYWGIVDIDRKEEESL